MQVSTLLLTPVVRPATSRSATPSEAMPFSYWSINLGFIIKGKLAAVLIIPSSWGLPTTLHKSSSTQRPARPFLAPLLYSSEPSIKTFLAALPGRKTTSARGVSRSQSFYFVFVLLVLFYFILFVLFYQKPKKISYYYYCFCLHCYIKNQKKLVSIIAFISVALFSAHYDS